MRTLLLLSLLCLAGCSSMPVRRAISVEPVRSKVIDSQSAVIESKASVKVAKSKVQDAQVTAAKLFQQAPVDLRPLVEELQEKLAGANQELALAESKSETAIVLLTEARAKADVLQSDVDHQSAKMVATQDKLEQVTAARNTLQWTVWKWRGISALIVAGIVAFFVARQYLPFLKLI